MPVTIDPQSYQGLDRLGRLRLSPSFHLREFLYSEIATHYGIRNVPDAGRVDEAVYAGAQLCERLLEPLQARFGRVHIRSGYRSRAVNAAGAGKHNCAVENDGFHTWDWPSPQHGRGATACISVPSVSRAVLSGAVHFEAEIAVLIGKPLSKKPSEEEVRDAISGYAPALDLTLRDVQAKLKEKGLPWELAKSFDGAYVLAPFVAADAVEDVRDIGIRLSIDGQLRQDGNSRDMLNPIIPLIQHIAGHFSLQPGDVVSTGTPAGVGPLTSGEQLDIELVGLSRFGTRVL